MPGVDTDTAEIRGRMVKARKAADLSQVALGKLLSMGASTVSGYETGRFELTLAVLQGYERETGRPLEWLVRGDTQALSRAELLRMLDREKIMDAAEPHDDPTMLKYRPGYQALLADAQARARAGLTDADLEDLGAFSVPVEAWPLRTKRSLLTFWAALRAGLAADED